MAAKEVLLVPVATTIEAFLACVRDQPLVFSVENPLYGQMSTGKCCITGLEHYETQNCEEKEFTLYLRTGGKDPFNPRIHELFYLPLQRKS